MNIRVVPSLILFYFIFHPISMLHSMEEKSSLAHPNPQNRIISPLPFSNDELINDLASEVNVPADATAGPNITRNFQALPDNNTYIPPDTHGAAGPNHLMTMLNTQVRIQDKNGNVISTQTLAQFWSNAPGANGTEFDPRIVYDKESGRWFAICGTSPGSVSSGILLAVSTTNDPTGGWIKYRIDAHPNDTWWADYPNIGFNSTWIAITANMIDIPLGLTRLEGMWVINKNDAITGQLGVPKRFFGFTGSGVFDGDVVGSGTMAPCVTFGSESKLYIADHNNYVSGGKLLLRLSEITGPIDDPIWQVTPGSTWDSTGLFPTNLSVGGGALNAEQPGTSTRIETDVYLIGNRLLNAVFRNGKIWSTHHSVVPYVGPWNSLDVIWYEIRPSSMPNALVQSGIISGNNEYYYYPSIAVNAREDILIGFTRSSTSIYAQAAYTGRRATDPLGFMNPISVLKLGEDTYEKYVTPGRIRWGDYSATVVDPTNDIEMWTIQEYSVNDVGPNPSDDRWGTWWGLACECIAKSGDATADGSINLADIVFLENYVFKGGPAPNPFCRGDATGDGKVLLTDMVYLVNYVFKGGPPPVKTCQCCV